MNFNKVDTDGKLIRKIREAVEAMATEEWLWVWLKQYDHDEQIDFDEETSHLVHRVRLRAAFENEGKANKGLHVHILIEIAHVTLVQLSKQGIVQVFSHFVRLNPNVHCRFVKGEGEDKDFILHYLTKEVPHYKPESQLNSRLKYAFAGRNEEQEEELVL